MPHIYRFLTEEDSAAFCHKVSLALAKGWVLHGSPQYTFDAAAGKLMCGQAVTKEIPGDYHPDMKLGDQ